MIQYLILIAATTISAPTTATPPNRAAEVFQDVCVDGGGQFGPDEIEAIDSSDVPRRARRIAMFALWMEEFTINGHNFVEDDEMPSRAFRIIDEDDIFLTVADETPTNPVQATCTVYVKGDSYEELAEYAAALTSNELPDLRQSNVKVAFTYGDFGVAVATGLGSGQKWTLIASAPLQ